MAPNLENKFNQLGYKHLTPIQEAVYQDLVDNKDVVGIAPTGSGKTLAFLFPILEKIQPKQGTQVLILTPSQELAMQTTRVFREWSKVAGVKTQALIGGANIKRQAEQLKKRPEIIIGTPGRIINLLNDKAIKPHTIKTVVLDEADDLLEEKSVSKIKDILSNFKNETQFAYFSATSSPILYKTESLVGKPAIMTDVRRTDNTRGKVDHLNLEISRPRRISMLEKLLRVNNLRALVYFNDINTLNKTFSYFKHAGNKQVAELTSKDDKMRREQALRDFRLGHTKMLLTTDVVGRGLDIPKLPAVINYDLPKDETVYIHRSGRTGRQGEPGKVINFGNEHDFRNLKKKLSNTDYKLDKIYFYNDDLTDDKPPQNDSLNLEEPKDHKKTSSYQHKFKTKAQKVNKPGTKKGKIKKKVKHNKNKGMRKKWKLQDKK